jgi:hypothetical protein
LKPLKKHIVQKFATKKFTCGKKKQKKTHTHTQTTKERDRHMHMHTPESIEIRRNITQAKFKQQLSW